jgi:hypothetical protein
VEPIKHRVAFFRTVIIRREKYPVIAVFAHDGTMMDMIFHACTGAPCYKENGEQTGHFNDSLCSA